MNDDGDLHEYTQALEAELQSSLGRRLGIAEGAGLQIRRFTSQPLEPDGCALCGTGIQVTEGVVHILFDGQREVGLVCETCLLAGPVGASHRARERADELCQPILELRWVAERLEASGAEGWTYPRHSNETTRGDPETAERDELRTKLATWYVSRHP